MSVSNNADIASMATEIENYAINSKEELIEKMKDMLEHFEEKYNKLEQDEENMEVYNGF